MDDWSLTNRLVHHVFEKHLLVTTDDFQTKMVNTKMINSSTLNFNN
jgi:hypothetical protein